MNKDFDIAIKFIFKWEGELIENKNDPGGITKYGISQKAHPYLNIKDLTLKEAKEIYFKNYWLKANCDKISFPLNFCIFDTAVNCGVRRAKEFMTKSLGWQDYLFKRIEFYIGLKNFKYFGRGWIRRTADLYELIKKETKKKI